MDKVINTERIPIKIWTDHVEEKAMEQARNLANLPFAFKHIALMPDCHCGYGMPIGGVMATRDVVVPNAVGVDIGCGMTARELDLRPSELKGDKLKRVMSSIRERIPVGFDRHDERREHPLFDSDIPISNPVADNIESAHYQLGTLGGGNHFIEVQTDDCHVWLMIHSGSRNFGYRIAKYYHEVARDLCKSWHSNIPTPDLAFLPLDSGDGKEYIAAMEFAMAFAKASRERMVSEATEAVRDVFPGTEAGPVIDVHHNYARMENHFGNNVLVHRKGATAARDGEIGIIPGSQGTTSYIVRGKGNRDSFSSCSHGAGRLMSRTKARKTLSLADETRRLDNLGIIHSIRTESDLDEAASAYKDIDEVMNHQNDLVDKDIILHPMAVIKG